MLDRTRFSRLMRSLGRRRTNATLLLDRSIVHCPERGDVELELCLACPALKRLVGDPISAIECEARSPTLDGAVQPY